MNKSFLDFDGLTTLWNQFKSYFVKKEKGKGLSTNDFTNTYKKKLEDDVVIVPITKNKYDELVNKNNGVLNDNILYYIEDVDNM